jgi:Tfp pilus assembly protein PilF
MLLQRGIAAARAGRTTEALQLLHRVVQVDPGSEMAWLWLSGLMSTNGHKRACLERVLQANPENAYARASLVRLQNTPKTDTGALEYSLGLGSSDYALTP